KVSGGLHGVGLSVVNALSESAEARVMRDGFEHTQTYARGAPTSKVKKGAPTRKHGTSIHFRPDPEAFGEKLRFDAGTIRDRREARAYPHAGLLITLRDDAGATAVFQHPNGIADYLPDLVQKRGKPVTHPTPFYVAKENGARVEAILQWTESP